MHIDFPLRHLLSNIAHKSLIAMRSPPGSPSGHVYSDPTRLSGERLIEKRQVMDAPGARFASAAFVTGALDRISSRADFLALAASAAVPILLIYGAETPWRSSS